MPAAESLWLVILKLLLPVYIPSFLFGLSDGLVLSIIPLFARTLVKWKLYSPIALPYFLKALIFNTITHTPKLAIWNLKKKVTQDGYVGLISAARSIGKLLADIPSGRPVLTNVWTPRNSHACVVAGVIYAKIGCKWTMVNIFFAADVAVVVVVVVFKCIFVCGWKKHSEL